MELKVSNTLENNKSQKSSPSKVHFSKNFLQKMGGEEIIRIPRDMGYKDPKMEENLKVLTMRGTFSGHKILKFLKVNESFPSKN